MANVVLPARVTSISSRSREAGAARLGGGVDEPQTEDGT